MLTHLTALLLASWKYSSFGCQRLNKSCSGWPSASSSTSSPSSTSSTSQPSPSAPTPSSKIDVCFMYYNPTQVCLLCCMWYKEVGGISVWWMAPPLTTCSPSDPGAESRGATQTANSATKSIACQDHTPFPVRNQSLFAEVGVSLPTSHTLVLTQVFGHF